MDPDTIKSITRLHREGSLRFVITNTNASAATLLIMVQERTARSLRQLVNAIGPNAAHFQGADLLSLLGS